MKGLFPPSFLKTGVGRNSRYLFQFGSNCHATKQYVYRMLKPILEYPRFKRERKVHVGSHSIRKFASSLAAQSGCTEDEIDKRGRWQQTRRVVQRYITFW